MPLNKEIKPYCRSCSSDVVKAIRYSPLCQDCNKHPVGGQAITRYSLYFHFDTKMEGMRPYGFVEEVWFLTNALLATGLGHTLVGQVHKYKDQVRCVLVLVALGWGHLTDFKKPAFMSRGPFSQALILSGGARFIAWHLRHPFLGECQWGSRHF